MKVGLQATLLYTGAGARKAGIGRHTIQILDQLSKNGRGHEYEVFVPSHADLPESWTASPWMRFHQFQIDRQFQRGLTDHFMIGKSVKQLGCDILFGLHPAMPLSCPIPMGAVMHDAFVSTHPEMFTFRTGTIPAAIHAHACRQCRRIVTVSEFSKREIARAYKKNLEEIKVVYNGPGNDLAAMDPETAARVDLQAVGVKFQRYLFTLSTVEPRKNLPRLMEALKLLLSDPTYADLGLVVAGAKGWMESPIFQRVTELGLADKIAFLGYVPDETIPALFARAEAFAFPSIVEGFGIPALESMIMGTPLVCSNTSSLPEVAGDAAFYCDPLSPESIAQAIRDCLSNPAERGAKVALGLERSKLFTWEKAANEIAETFQEIANAP